MSNILVISGKKCSGKSNITKYLYGYHMLQLGVIKEFGFKSDGDLLVPTRAVDGKSEMGVFDIYRTDDEFKDFLAGAKISGEIERFSFADSLKQTVTDIFGIDPSLYLTNDGKNTETHIPWTNMKKLLAPTVIARLKKEGKFDRNMTVREILEYFGTHVCRHMDDVCWVRSTFARASQSQAKLVVIDDCRFPNELEYSKKYGAKVIRLRRKIEDSTVESETALDDVMDSEWDLLIDNSEMSMKQKNELVTKYLVSIGWLKDGVLE